MQATLFVGESSYDIPISRIEDPESGKVRYALGTKGDNGEYSFFFTDETNFQVSGGGLFDPDPSISYGISVIDFGTPTNFGFIFTTPIVPTSAPNLVSASISGGLTDTQGDGVSITPLFADSDGDGIPELQIANVNAPFTNMGVDVGPAQSNGNGSLTTFPYGSFNAGPIPGPGPGPFTELNVQLSFQLSGGGDIASLTGIASIIPVPEPSSLVLAGLGLAGLGLIARRHRRRTA
ncbi:MAG: PEP-CTERM sorting domain-containing protein [Pirellulales bacterium]|nr:PEP-CTERM sorting domain-containing protein [Pirellulales bacterium]